VQSRVYETIKRPSVSLSVSLPVCPSVCLSHHSTVAAACGGFAAERGQEISIDSGGRQAPEGNGAAARARGRGRTSLLLRTPVSGVTMGRAGWAKSRVPRVQGPRVPGGGEVVKG